MARRKSKSRKAVARRQRRSDAHYRSMGYGACTVEFGGMKFDSWFKGPLLVSPPSCDCDTPDIPMSMEFSCEMQIELTPWGCEFLKKHEFISEQEIPIARGGYV